MGKSHLTKRSASSAVKKGSGVRNPVALARRLMHGQNRNTVFARAAAFGRR